MKTKLSQQNEQTDSLAASLPPLEYRPLHGDHVGAFSCGEADIDKYFKKTALNEHKKILTRTMVATFEGKDDVVAFYSLGLRTISERSLKGTEKQDWKARFRHDGNSYIGISLDFLAVSKNIKAKELVLLY